MSCQNYDQCVHNTQETLKHPTDSQSLYATKIYDNQTANRRCYETTALSHRPNIIEGFRNGTLLQKLIRIAIFIAIIYVIYMVITGGFKPYEEVSIPTDTLGPMTPSSPLIRTAAPTTKRTNISPPSASVSDSSELIKKLLKGNF